MKPRAYPVSRPPPVPRRSQDYPAFFVVVWVRRDLTPQKPIRISAPAFARIDLRDAHPTSGNVCHEARPGKLPGRTNQHFHKSVHGRTAPVFWSDLIRLRSQCKFDFTAIRIVSQPEISIRQ